MVYIYTNILALTNPTTSNAVGAGTQAAGGVALNVSVNVTDRPMTGQGVMGMKSSTGGGGRLVEDTAYYVGLLRKKMKVWIDLSENTSKVSKCWFRVILHI